MKISLLELPILLDASEPRVLFADSAPMGLLRLAGGARRHQWQVEFRDAEAWWPPQALIGKLPEDPQTIWLLDVHPYNAPTAHLLLAAIADLDSKLQPPLAVCAQGIQLPVGEGLRLITSEGAEGDLWRQLRTLGGGNGKDPATVPESGERWQLPSAELLDAWPRWDRHLSSLETFGFSPDRLPHPWNLPGSRLAGLSEVKRWLPEAETVLTTCREPNLWLSFEQEAPDLDLISALGDIALHVLRKVSTPAKFGLRATPRTLSGDATLPNLSLLDVRRLDLLAGSLDSGVLNRWEAGYGPVELEESLKQIVDCGLADQTRILFVLGSPGENADSVLGAVRQAVETARKHGLAALSFEWWCNVPGSSTHLSQFESACHRADAYKPWFRDAAPAPYDSLKKEEKAVVAESIGLLALAHPEIEIMGPAML